MIELQHLTKRFDTKAGKFVALKDISLTIQDGDIYGIIGMSGAGKSTLVRCINMLEKPDEGSVIVNGRKMETLDARELRQARREIAMIFQQFNLLMQRSCLKNVCFPMELAGVPKEKAEARARELLELVGLPDKADSYPAQLSGGQKQRVAIARALATDPKAILDAGKVVEEGSVAEIFSNPKTPAARRLVFPAGAPQGELPAGHRLVRVAFNGTQTTDKPLVASLAIECGALVSIVAADTRLVNGQTLGSMLLALPDNADEAEKAIAYIRNYPGLTYEEVQA